MRKGHSYDTAYLDALELRDAVGKPRGEAALLSAAAVLEDLLELAKMTPIEPRVL